jgi:hypothetical protein
VKLGLGLGGYRGGEGRRTDTIHHCSFSNTHLRMLLRYKSFQGIIFFNCTLLGTTFFLFLAITLIDIVIGALAKLIDVFA